jgi:hypothetical protein
MTYYELCRRNAKEFPTNDLAEMIDKLEKATLIAEGLDMFRALKDEYAYRTWDNQANYDRLLDSAKMGGSFNRDIIAAFFSADNNNKPRLVEAFPEIFNP